MNLNDKIRYVKEFAHSDFGRTLPNLGTLLNTTADILELDVEVTNMNFHKVVIPN